MNQAFYDGMIIRIKSGQYTLDEIDRTIDKAAGAGFFGSGEETGAIITELKALAREHIDAHYIGNSEPRAYDFEQDITIFANTETSVELFDMVMLITDSLPMALSKTEKAVYVKTLEAAERAVTRSAIADSYVTLIVLGRRTFDDVHITKKEEVAEKLIIKGRDDLITDINYLPVEYIAKALIEGRFVFDDVPSEHKQAVADLLVAQERQDLVTDEEYIVVQP